MKKLLLFLTFALPLAFTACSDKNDDDAQSSLNGLEITTLAGEKLSAITLNEFDTFDFKVSVKPANASFNGNDFTVRLANGGNLQYVNFTIKTVTSGFVIITAEDDGSFYGSEPYRLSVVVEHKPSRTVSEPFIVTTLPRAQQSTFSLSLAEVPATLKTGGSEKLTIAVKPASTILDGDKFELLTDKNTQSQYVSLKYSGNEEGIYSFNLKDKRSAYQPFSEVLKVVYNNDQETVSTQTFTLSSAEPLKISKVYITLADGYNREQDLDAKKSYNTGYADDGSGFETQFKTDEREWVDATIRIDAADGFDDLAEMTTKIKGRGNTTWGWSKKPYNLKLDSKSKVLGMKKHKRWCLIANAIDRTHLRNWLAYNISRQMTFDYAVHGQFVELYFINQDGSEDYRGLYFLSEHIKEDADARVPLTEVKETQTGVAGDQIGFLLEFDMNYDEPGKFLTTTSRLPINIKYPAQEDWEDAGNIDQYNIYKEYISGYVNEVDKLINQLQKDGNSDQLWEKLDIESMANFWIVFETMSCREILWPKSIYFHKDVNQKLKAGPTWDFDYRTLNASDVQQWINHQSANAANTTTQYWAKKSGRTWWAQLIQKDATFRAEIKKQWAVIYPKMQAIQSTEIDEMKALLKEADEHNSTIWRQSDIGSNPNEDKGQSFDGAITTLKNNFNTRISWLNSQINSWQ